MDMRKILLLILVVFLAAVLLFFIINPGLNPTGESIEEYYSTYTKAICNETNFCQDYEIICRGREIVDIKAITGAVIQHPRNWDDPRPPEEKERFCE